MGDMGRELRSGQRTDRRPAGLLRDLNIADSASGRKSSIMWRPRGNGGPRGNRRLRSNAAPASAVLSWTKLSSERMPALASTVPTSRSWRSARRAPRPAHKSPIWRGSCQGVAVGGHCLVGGAADVVAACGAVRASAGFATVVMLISGGFSQDLCSSARPLPKVERGHPTPGGWCSGD
jgi:hypothetical protein